MFMVVVTFMVNCDVYGCCDVYGAYIFLSSAYNDHNFMKISDLDNFEGLTWQKYPKITILPPVLGPKMQFIIYPNAPQTLM